MASRNELLKELKTARSELKNIRQELQKLKIIHNNYVKSVGNVVKQCEKCSCSAPCKNEKDSAEGISDKDFIVKPIGYIRSCFKTKNGTPRQPALCPQSKAYLKIDKAVFNNPEHSLTGLQEFSHIWVLFMFHKNRPVKSVKAKVHPPRLDGFAVGVFSTRSPHRPNPIGLSLIKVERIEGSTLFLSGVDLLDGTPVLDIKPYIPSYDIPFSETSVHKSHYTTTRVLDLEEEQIQEESDIPIVFQQENHSLSDQEIHESNAEVKTVGRNNSADKCFLEQNMQTMSDIVKDNAKIAEWLSMPLVPLLEVSFTTRAEADMQKFHIQSEHHQKCDFCLDFLGKTEEVKQIITKLLQNDPRSVYRRNKCSDRLYYCFIDNIHITCWFDETTPVVEVLRVYPSNIKTMMHRKGSS